MDRIFDRLLVAAPKRVRSEDDKRNWPQNYIKTDLELAMNTNIISVVDRIIEPQTVAHFVAFSALGELPDGTKTSSPLIHPKEIDLFETPYAEWAPAPFSEKTHPHSAVDRLMIRIGSDEDPDRMCLVEKHLHALKTRLWEGMPPMADYRWHERNLDELQNHALACQHLSAVTDVFSYLNKPSVKTRLRQTYDLMYDELNDFDRAINAHRMLHHSSKDPKSEEMLHDKSHERLSMTGLWKEYMQAHFRIMTTTAHSWVSGHIKRLREHRLIEYIDLIARNGDDAYSYENLLCGDRMQDLQQIQSFADFAILIPMGGYKGFEISTSGASMGLGNLSERREKYMTEVKRRTHTAIWDDGIRDAIRRRRGEGALPFGINFMTSQISAQAAVARDMRGECSEIGMLPWVWSLVTRFKQDEKCKPAKKQTSSEDVVSRDGAVAGDDSGAADDVKESGQHSVPTDEDEDLLGAVKLRKDEAWGFVAYRLDYRQTKEAWDRFVRVLNRDMAKWSQGLKGVETIKDLAMLQWIDGRGVGIAEGDVNAAKEHFQKFRESESLVPGLSQNVFFVADHKSTSSYLPSPTLSGPNAVNHGTGLSGGHLLLVDAEFDPNELDTHADERPGWQGEMRVLGSLIFGEIAAVLESQSLLPELLWPLASGHPKQIYVGVTANAERGVWENIPGIKPEIQDILRGAAAMVGERYLRELGA